VAVAPLGSWQRPPDIVIFIVDPYRAMRLIQARSYTTGVQRSFGMVGNRGSVPNVPRHPWWKTA
jgi:uncharacterized protein (DUF169 family)